MRPDADCGQTHLAAGWVLGTLTSEEAGRYEAHLATCATCRAEVASLRAAADALADAVPALAPPSGLRVRLMAAVRREAELSRAAGAQETDPVGARRPRRHLLRGALLVVAAVALVGAGTVLGGALADPQDRQARSRTSPGVVTPAAGAAGARAAIRVRGDSTTLVLLDVKAPPKGQIYQAWLQRPTRAPVPTGALFSVGATGDTAISLPPLRDAQRMIVTSEPSGGATIPTLPPVMVVDLPAPGRTSR